jgi:hypothetical protein
MQNLRKLSILTITVLCANYGSTFAQDEQKAFKEGDKILSIGVGPAYNSPYSFGYYGNGGTKSLASSISFDYGLKGTHGIVSIGGFMSYSQNNLGNTGINFGGVNQDSIYIKLKGFEYKSHSITAGLRFALHYSTRKWDLYAGTMIGVRSLIVESRTGTVEYYKGLLPGGYSLPNAPLIKSESETVSGYKDNQMIFSPYVGARYYVTKKVGLNLELGQSTGNVGLSFKF